MNREFGKQLKSLRVEHRLTQAQLAQRAGISVRTLTTWEKGRCEPREYELRALLHKLEVPTAKQPPLFGLLTSPRAHKMASEVAPSLSSLSTLPTSGDLLAAMRLRRGLNRKQAAAHIGVNLSTLSRWETNQVQPSEEVSLQYALQLGAYPEEVQALQTRRLAPIEPETTFSLERYEQEVEQLVQEIHRPHSYLIDLMALSLKRRLWLQATANPEALPLLAQVDYSYSHWLLFQDRPLEAERHAEQSMQVLTAHTQPSRWWTKAINILAAIKVEKQDKDMLTGFRVTRNWIEHISHSTSHSYLLCDMALYLARSGQIDTAWGLFKQNQTLLNRVEDQNFEAGRYIRMTTARILLEMGQPERAYAQAPRPLPLESETLFNLFLYGTMCAKAGEKSELERVLTHLNAALTQWHRPRLRRSIDALIAQV